jgi:prepilin-type N-terminal cleavage/methylation domain-containing protein
MASKSTYTNSAGGGFTLVEMMVALGAGSLLFLALAATSLFGARSFLVTSNYVTLQQQSRLGVDYLSRDIRQANKVLACSSNSLSLLSGTNTILVVYDPAKQTLKRILNGGTNVLLSACNYVRFDMFQRNTTNGTYDYYPAASTNTCKVVQVTYACSAPVYGTTRQNVSVQHSAKIVIRKQK